LEAMLVVEQGKFGTLKLWDKLSKLAHIIKNIGELT